MNYFLELKIYNHRRVVRVRPEHVTAVEHRDDDPYEYVYLTSGDTFLIERGQLYLNTLINRTSHAGMRVL
jgi:hypothetical protein